MQERTLIPGLFAAAAVVAVSCLLSLSLFSISVSILTERQRSEYIAPLLGLSLPKLLLRAYGGFADHRQKDTPPLPSRFSVYFMLHVPPRIFSLYVEYI